MDGGGQTNLNDERKAEAGAHQTHASSSSTINMQALIPYIILAAVFLISIYVSHADSAANRAENAATLRVMHEDAMAAGEAKARADNAYALAQEAKMEARVLQDKVEDLRLEIAKGKGKP